MVNRQLGKNGPRITTIGFGAWAIGGPWQWGWGEVDDKESIEAINKAIENGINWIDTAAVYGYGHSEKVVGEAIKEIREKVFLATKCGMINDGSGNAVINNDPENIRKECEESLKKLKTDYIDLYQIHWPDENVEVERSWEMMVQLKDEGKVKYIGVCNFDVELIKRCMKIERVQSLQPPYSMLRRNVENEILPYCLQNEIGVVVYSPMQAGLLTGKFDMNKLAPDDWRRKGASFREPNLSKALKFVDKLKPIAESKNISVGNLAVGWVLSNNAVTSAIVGARNSKQVKENVIAADLKLSESELDEIKSLLNETGL
ncbi:MAG: aldo/keto reductase [Melioribacter sp.]|nr:aldo/keto reductase [Melioribacter sp.]